MTLIKAIKAAASGAIIVSNAGNRYTAADLSPIRCGESYVSFRKARGR